MGALHYTLGYLILQFSSTLDPMFGKFKKKEPIKDEQKLNASIKLQTTKKQLDDNDSFILKKDKPLGSSPSALGLLGADKSKITKSKNNAAAPTNKHKNIIRRAGGKVWTDPSLAEWDPSHFRLFVGNLSQEVTDSMLQSAFSQFPSLSKVKVVLDKKTNKAKGFAFVAFSDPEDYFKAFKEMNGKYVGNHPIQLKRANTDISKSK